MEIRFWWLLSLCPLFSDYGDPGWLQTPGQMAQCISVRGVHMGWRCQERWMRGCVQSISHSTWHTVSLHSSQQCHPCLPLPFTESLLPKLKGFLVLEKTSILPSVSWLALEELFLLSRRPPSTEQRARVVISKPNSHSQCAISNIRNPLQCKTKT